MLSNSLQCYVKVVLLLAENIIVTSML